MDSCPSASTSTYTSKLTITSWLLSLMLTPLTNSQLRLAPLAASSSWTASTWSASTPLLELLEQVLVVAFLDPQDEVARRQSCRSRMCGALGLRASSVTMTGRCGWSLRNCFSQRRAALRSQSFLVWPSWRWIGSGARGMTSGKSGWTMTAPSIWW